MLPLLDDELWSVIAPLLPLPKKRRRRHPGRKPLSNRQALTGILFVLRSGIPWKMLPKEMGCGSGSTCWRRFADWTRLSVWSRLHALLLTTLGKAGAIHLERAVMDSASVRAVFGGRTPVPIRRIVRKQAVSAMC